MPFRGAAQMAAVVAGPGNRDKRTHVIAFEMEYRYAFPWHIVSHYVLEEKAKGPPDDKVTLVVDHPRYDYKIKMPWYARPILGKEVHWQDVITIDRENKIHYEIGNNMNVLSMGSCVDTSMWKANALEPDKYTDYKKEIVINVLAGLAPDIAIRVSGPLIKWFKKKSHVARQVEEKAIAKAWGDAQREEKDKAEAAAAALALRKEGGGKGLQESATAPVSPSSSAGARVSGEGSGIHARDVQRGAIGGEAGADKGEAQPGGEQGKRVEGWGLRRTFRRIRNSIGL